MLGAAGEEDGFGEAAEDEDVAGDAAGCALTV